MEIEVSSSNPCVAVEDERKNKADKDRVRVKKKSLQAVIEECQRALELLSNGGDADDEDECGKRELKQTQEESLGSPVDQEADELCDLLKSRLEGPDFLEKLESAQISVSRSIADENDISDQEDYVLVREEDIVEGIACFMAAYLLSLKQSKTFSVKKKKGKLRKAWEGSKVIYNVASWGATAIGLYQNPVVLRVASKAFWTSCHVISKLL
ncbi:hypothetical protein K2173_026714 [Erythroxylum novogranatense]|uniref:Uncharacterized protein n=1 Tax=Erythroxylum novogranatense TaxID=1862640 RepID=A0AAV8TX03_9ROSI|nr:hypothetical protein K2173_026714 [Erythroxylum novogranatense]